MNDIHKLLRIELLVIVLFVVGKRSRPFFLEGDYPEWWKIFLLSFPNFCEAIIGTLTLTMLGLIFNRRWLKPEHQLQSRHIYIIATLLASIYVIAQEFKLHNIGGKNVFDPMDVVFSVVGLIVAYTLVHFLQPKLTA